MRTFCAIALFIATLTTKGQVAGDTSVCAGDVIMYNVPVTTGASYSWSITGGSIVGASNADSCVIQWGAAGTGTIIVTVNPPSGGPQYHTLNVNIHPKPNPVITHSPYPTCPADSGGATGQPDHKPECDKVCKYSTITYCTPLNVGSTYQWTVIGAFSVSGATTNCVTVTWDSTLAGTLVVVETNQWGCVDSAEWCVEKVDLPVASFTGLSNVCKFSSTQFTNTSTGATSYFWDFGDGNTTTINSNPGHATHSYSSPGTYTVTLIAFNDCFCSDTFQRTITVDSLPGPQITCIETVCAFDTATYCTPAVSGCTYNWFINGGTIISGSGTPCITVVWGVGQLGTIGLQLTGCGGVCNDTTLVYIPIVPAVGTITGPAKVCPGECHTYSLPHFSGSIYNWTLSTSCGSVITDSTSCEEIEICFSPFASACNDTLTVSFWNAFLNCGGTAQLIIRIRPELSILGNSPVCSNQTALFFTSNSQPAFWSISPAGPNLSPSPAPAVTINWLGMTGNFILTAVPLNPNSVCNDSTFTLIKVIASPPAPVITGDTIVCANSTAQYCATGTHTINWIITGGTPSNGIGNCITVTWGNSGPFIVQAYQQLSTAPFCPSDTTKQNVQVVATITPPIINGLGTACANGTSTFTTPSTYPAGATFTWSISLPNAGTITSGQGSSTINVEWGNNAPQVVTITLTVNVCGQSASTNHTVTLSPAPTPSVIQLSPLCFGGSAQLQASGGTTYSWTGPGGYTATGSTVTIFVQGLYHVIATQGGCTGTSQIDVQYVSGPTASISTANGTTYCIGSTYSVTICALGNPNYTYLWSNGATTQCITVSVPGTYTVTVTDITNGCMSVSNAISVTEIPCTGTGTPCVPNGSVSFTNTQCNPVAFTNTSVNAFNFQWNFGDLSGSSLPNPPPHTYAQAGFYMITLCGDVINVTGTDTCRVCDTSQVVIPVVAKFDVTTGCNGDPVCFTDKSTTTFGTNITSWVWNFGDANSSFLQNPCHIYATPGTYVVTLTITGGGCTSVFTDTIIVPPPPTAAFSFTSPCCVGQPVQFTDASFPNIKTWSWSFGDAGTSLNQNPTHSYALPGPYVVTLIACDSLGCCDTVSQNKLVNTPTASGNITALPDTIVCAGTQVTLIAPTCGGCSYLWSTGSTNDSIIVTSTGIYVVTVTDAGGCPYTTFIKIIVNPNPPTTITNSGDDELCLGEFTNLSVPFHINFNWLWISNDPGVNGSTSSSVFVSPTVTGTYTYQVIVTDTSTGCFDTSLVYTIMVHPNPVPPIITALGPTTVCFGDTIVLVGSHPDTTVTLLWSTGEINDTISVTEGGCYTLTVTDTNGCENSATFCVTVNPLPDLCMFYEGCFDTCAPYVIMGPPGTSWQWLLNGNIISGATSQNYSANVSGAYSVIVTNSFGCFDTTGVLNLTLYPCPEDSSCADLVIDSIICDENGNYVMYYNVTNYTGYMVTEFTLQVLPPNLNLLYSPILVIDSIPNGGASPTYSATIFSGNVGDTLCFRTRLVARDSLGVEVLCCPSDTQCIVLPPCDSNCCYFRYLGDSITCKEGPAGTEYNFTLFIDGCGELTITQATGQGTLIGINNPYNLSGFTQISGTYISSTDTILCLTFVMTNGVIHCADTTICISLRCPDDSLRCDWEFDDEICEGQCTSFLYTGPTGGVTVSWSWPGGSPSTGSGPGPHTVCYSTAGMYFVTMTLNGNNQTVICRDTVFVSAPPVASITQTGNTLYAFPAGMTYQWTFGPPTYTPISGETNQFYSPQVSDLICVIVTDPFGCADTACIDFVPDGIGELTEASWSLYPNPNDGSFAVSLDVPTGTVEMRLLNALGEVIDVRRWDVGAKPQTFQVGEDGLPSGVYLVQLKTDKGTMHKSMVVR